MAVPDYLECNYQQYTEQQKCTLKKIGTFIYCFLENYAIVKGLDHSLTTTTILGVLKT